MRKFLRERTSDCKVKHPDLGNARLEVAHTFLTYVCYDTKDTHKLLSVSAFQISVVTYVGYNRGKLKCATSRVCQYWEKTLICCCDQKQKQM